MSHASSRLDRSSAGRPSDIPYRHKSRADNEDANSNSRLSYFLPSESIDYDVIKADLKSYLGADASVEQHRRSGSNRNGYLILSSTKPTIAMIEDLKAGSKRWADEQKRDRALTYAESSTHRERHQNDSRRRTSTVTVSRHEHYDTTPMTDSEQSTHHGHYAQSRHDADVPNFESVGDIGQAGFSRTQLGKPVNQTSVREPRPLCESPRRISLVPLRDVHSYLTEILGKNDSKKHEVYLECARLKSLLRTLRILCEQDTKHDVNFVMENTHTWDRADHSPGGAQRLLNCIGLSDPNKRRQHRVNRSSFEDDFSQLRQALVKKATDAQLILIYHSVCGGSIEEALSECLLGKDKSWLRSRTACILSVDTIHATELETQCNCGNDINERGTCRAYSRWEQSRASLNLWGYLKCVKLHRVCGDTSMSPSELNPRPQTSFERTLRFAATRRDFAEVWCGIDDFVDCFLWSILQVIEGGQHHFRRLVVAQASVVDAYVGGHDSGPLPSFKALLRDKESAEASIILKALRWVAFSGRLLSIDEVVAAVNTPTDLQGMEQPCAVQSSTATYRSTAELLELCTGFLEVARDRFVAISDANLRNYILSPKTSARDRCHEAEIHEMMAKVCLRHLQCLHSEATFRPWLGTESWLTGKSQPCPLRNYSTTSWHEHVRHAQSYSRVLSTLLDARVRSALAFDNGPILLFQSDRRVNYAFWLCSIYDLSAAGMVYQEMNANMELQHACGERLLHVAAANGSLKMLKLLLEKGADTRYWIKDTTKGVRDWSVPISSDAVAAPYVHRINQAQLEQTPIQGSGFICRNEVTPLHLAACHGHLSAVRLLLQANFEVNAVTASTMETAIHIAARAGHEQIVQYLLQSGADPEAKNAAGELALQIAVEQGHTSIVNLLTELNVKAKSQYFPQSALGGEVLGSQQSTSLGRRQGWIRESSYN